MSQDYVTPSLPSGFRDYLPPQMIARQKMLDIIRSVFERFGFQPLGTPSVERREVLTGGDPDFGMQIFNVYRQNPDSSLALRFDLTIPLARVFSMYQLEKPFKRYQYGTVFRGERPQVGRYCEFMQFDADIVGSNRMSADAEVVSLIFETLSALGVTDFCIRVNNRKILNGLAEYIGYPPEESSSVLRIVDKLDKIGWEEVSRELVDQVGLDKPQLEKLKKFLELRSDNAEDTISSIRGLMESSSVALEGAEELQEIMTCVDALGVPRKVWKIDLSIARGLGYYTGPVFETTLQGIPEIGSIFSGGRYDGLVTRFNDARVPATGASIGVDRLFEAITKIGGVNTKDSLIEAMVLNFDLGAEAYCLQVTQLLRNAGIRTEIYLGEDSSLRGQLSHALKKESRVVLIAGGNEAEHQTVQVKDVKTKTQKEVPLDAVVAEVQNVISS